MSPSLTITGIGSRKTSQPACLELKAVGVWVQKNGHQGRSGHAEAADWAFECGCVKSCEVFLPWPGFNTELAMCGVPIVVEETEELNDLVRKYHPAPQHLKRGGWALMRRNCCQVLGKTLDKKSDATVYYAPGDKGGTGFAVRMSKDLGIPCLNMALPEWSTAKLVIKELERINETKGDPQ